MRRLVSLCIIPLALVILTFGARSQEKVDAGLEQIKKDITYLASDECEGRGVETEGINKAADYLAQQFKYMNLKTATKEGSYFQKFTIPGLAKLATPNSLVLVGPEGKKIDAKLGEQFNVSGLTGKGKAGGGIVFVGYGITVGEKEYDDYRDIDTKDKIVLILRQTPRMKNDKEPFHPDANQFAALSAKLANAEKHKAAAVLFVNDKDKAGENDDLMPFDYSRGQGAGTIPVLHMRRALAEQMLATSSHKLADLESAIDRDLKPHSFALKDWQANIETTVERVDLPAKNVVAVLDGAGPLANETVVLGAHYDHLGRGERGSRSKGSKAIHYGADDNASGTTAVLELARRFSAMKNRQGRRLVFILFSGEERGLLGSAYYCKEPLFPLQDTVAMINLDMVGRLRADEKTQKDKLEIGGIGSAKSFEKLIDSINEKFNFQITKTRSGTGPSDHTSFYIKGVPVFFFFTGFHNEYHMPSDKVELINLAGIKKVCDLVETLAQNIATTKERPEYVKGATGASPSGSGPRLGFMPAQYDDDETKGVPVGDVVPGGAAEKGGIKAGDWIIEVAGQPVKNMQGYMKIMSAQKKGQELEITVQRSAEKVKVKVVPQ